MRFPSKSSLLYGALVLSLCFSACSKPTENSELEEIRQELAELKKEMAKGVETEVQPEINQPDSDDLAFEKAKSDGRVRAFGDYAKSFADGRHLIAADEGAWGSADRQNSVLAYEAYRKYFPQGKYIQDSYKNTMSVQNRLATKALVDLGYDDADFPTFNAASIDTTGKIELPSRDKAELEQIAKAKAAREEAEKNRVAAEEAKRLERIRQEVAKQEEARQKILRAEALKIETQRQGALREAAKKRQALEQKALEEREYRKRIRDLEGNSISGERRLYVINFRSARNPANKILDVSISQAVSISDAEIDYLIIDFSTAARWEKGAHEAFDRDIVPVFNQWTGRTGFVAAVDADFKYIMGCFDETFTASEMAQILDKMVTATSKTSYDSMFGKSIGCPKPELGDDDYKLEPAKFLE